MIGLNWVSLPTFAASRMRFGIPILGAFIGGVSGGIAGGVIGFIIGFFIEYLNSQDDPEASKEQPRQQGQSRGGYNETDIFASWLLTLIAAMMNADGSAMKSELELVKRMLIRTYGEYKAQEYLLKLRDLLKQHHNIPEVCRNLRNRVSYGQRLELLHVLFKISNADNHINRQEMDMLVFIGNHLGISSHDFGSLRAMFEVSADSDYLILEVDSNATEEIVKKAYRKKAMEFHPDRVVGLNEAEKKVANEKFLRVQKAYENIKAKRGWS